MLITKRGKRETPEGTEIPNQEIIRMVTEKENYKFLGILGADTIKQVEMKKKYEKSTSDKTKLCSRNLVKGKNTWEIPLVRYSRPFLK